jgi:hypothetical protein
VGAYVEIEKSGLAFCDDLKNESGAIVGDTIGMERRADRLRMHYECN